MPLLPFVDMLLLSQCPFLPSSSVPVPSIVTVVVAASMTGCIPSLASKKMLIVVGVVVGMEAWVVVEVNLSAVPSSMCSLALVDTIVVLRLQFDTASEERLLVVQSEVDILLQC